MKILSLELANDTLIGYREVGPYYIKFEIDKANNVTDLEEFKVSKYRNYLHFVGVLGKFNPYTQFFKKPSKLKVLSYNELIKIFKKSE